MTTPLFEFFESDSPPSDLSTNTVQLEYQIGTGVQIGDE